MKILILTCNTGAGHNSVSAALQQVCEQRGIPCDIVDALSFISPKASRFICNWHTRIYRCAPIVFRTGYEFAENHGQLFEENHILNKYLLSGIERLEAAVERGEYDCIIAVHVFTALMATTLLRKREKPLLTCFVATDYTCSPIANESNLDLYFIPHQDLIGEFAQNGIPTEKIRPYGIPVRPAFHENLEKNEAKKLFGIPQQERTVLLMSGSMGCGPFEELMEMISFRLPEDTTLTIVCGSNQKIYHTLLDKAAKNVRVLGQVSNISALMDCSEMIITKPGGLTVSEAAAKRLPLLLLDIVGGCETYNLNFFTQKGWAEHRPTLEQTAQLCCTLLDHPEVLAQKRKLLAQGFPNRPAEMLIDELCEAIKFKNSTVIQLSVDA